MHRNDETTETLIDQMKLVYKDYNLKIKSDAVTGNGTFIEIENFIAPGIEFGVYNTLIAFKFRKFDIIDYSSVETYLKPRLEYDNAKFYFNKREIKCYLYKEFPQTKKGHFEMAMYVFNAIDFIKTVIEKLLAGTKT